MFWPNSYKLKKSGTCVLLKYRYIPHNNNLLDLFVRPKMTCLWRHHCLHDVFTLRNSFNMDKISKKNP